MKIVRLEAANVKRLRAVQLDVEGQTTVVVRGNNGQGKTSVLDSIAMALGGAKLCPERPVREGAADAHASVHLDDGMVVTRTWAADGSSRLEVMQRDGTKARAPQTMLDGLTGRLSFDPLVFLRLPAREQADELRRVVGLDTKDLDAERAKAFERRTDANRLLGVLQGQFAALKDVPQAVAVDVGAKVKSLQLLQQSHDAAAQLQRQVDAAEQRLGERANAVEAARRALQQAEAQHADAEQQLARARAALANAPQAPTTEDIATLHEVIAAAGEINLAAAKWDERQRLAARIDAGEKHVAELTATITTCDERKRRRLAAIDMPVPGLAYDDDGVTLHGLPLAQASQAEQLRVSVAMGLAANPTLRVLLVRDASLLDANSLRLVAEMAAAADAQVWLEVVGKDGDGFVIEDGTVVS